jgi:hypothetical protein
MVNVSSCNNCFPKKIILAWNPFLSQSPPTYAIPTVPKYLGSSQKKTNRSVFGSTVVRDLREVILESAFHEWSK